MTTRLATLLRHDLRLQNRYGIFAAYGGVVLFYALVLIFAAPYLPDWLIALVIVTDPSVVGFFFIGGLMLLEKGEMSRTALAMTPARARDYLAAKTISMTGVALVTIIILGLLHPGTNWLLFLPTVTLISVAFVGAGAAIALRFRTVAGYLVASTGILTPIIGPGLLGLVIDPPWPLLLFPTIAQFRLTYVALGGASAAPAEIALMLAVILVTAIAGFWYGIRALEGEFGSK